MNWTSRSLPRFSAKMIVEVPWQRRPLRTVLPKTHILLKRTNKPPKPSNTDQTLQWHFSNYSEINWEAEAQEVWLVFKEYLKLWMMTIVEVSVLENSQRHVRSSKLVLVNKTSQYYLIYLMIIKMELLTMTNSFTKSEGIFHLLEWKQYRKPLLKSIKKEVGLSILMLLRLVMMLKSTQML